MKSINAALDRKDLRLLLVVAAGLLVCLVPHTAMAQTSTCDILEKIGSLEQFEREGLGISTDGSILIGQNYKSSEIKIWNSNNGRLINRMAKSDSGEIFARLANLSVNHDGSIVAARTKRSATVYIAEAESGKKLAEFLTRPFGNSSTMHLSPDGTRLFTGDWDRGAALWDARSGRKIANLTHSSVEYEPGKKLNFSRAAFNPDGTLLAVAFFNQIYLFDGVSGDFIRRIYTSMADPYSRNKTINYSNANAVYDIRFSPDGRFLANGGRGHSTMLWDVESGRLIGELEQSDRVLKLVFDVNSQFLATVSYNKRDIKVWETANGNHLYTVRGARPGPVNISFSETDTSLFALPNNDFVDFMNVTNGKLVQRCRGESGFFLPDGETFISWSKTEGVNLFRINRK